MHSALFGTHQVPTTSIADEAVFVVLVESFVVPPLNATNLSESSKSKAPIKRSCIESGAELQLCFLAQDEM